METYDHEQLKAQIEALIFASPSPMSAEEIENLIDNESINSKQIKNCLKELVEYYKEKHHGFALEVSQGKSTNFVQKEFSSLMEKLLLQSQKAFPELLKKPLLS